MASGRRSTLGRVRFCALASATPAYVARPELGDAIRICAHGNCLIVFEPYDDGSLILRVLHGARNLSGIV
jgi:toxin ParE1/3/4